uniref:NACHT domain-containing protein n=1 Tax=Anopheles dirus TaxID=7168 RepID=A0A182NDA1_9DIPT
MMLDMYSTDFSRLNHTDFQNLNDVQVLRLLYRFIHMALFSPNVISQSVTKNDTRRNIIDRCAEMFTLDTDSRIVLDVDQLVNADLTSQQLLELRIFQTKYNEKQIVLLLDGFDEICPHYKNVKSAEHQTLYHIPHHIFHNKKTKSNKRTSSMLCWLCISCLTMSAEKKGDQ